MMINMNSRDKKYMAFVRRLAINNPMPVKLAACLVLKNEIISVGYNSDKSHPMQKRFGKNSDSIFKHAEIDCILNSLKHIEKENLQYSTLYVYRVKKETRISSDFVDGLAKPCVGCSRAIEHFGIKKVVYSCDNGEFTCK